MKRYPLFLYVYLLVVGISAACGGGGGTEPESPSVTGVWSGDMLTPPPANGPRSISLTLQEANGDVTGSGDIADASGVPYYTSTVSGTHAHPAIMLTLNSAGFAPISVTGSFTNASTIEATLDGSGWVNTPVTLTRQ